MAARRIEGSFKASLFLSGISTTAAQPPAFVRGHYWASSPPRHCLFLGSPCPIVRACSNGRIPRSPRSLSVIDEAVPKRPKLSSAQSQIDSMQVITTATGGRRGPHLRQQLRAAALGRHVPGDGAGIPAVPLCRRARRQRRRPHHLQLDPGGAATGRQ